MIRGGMPYNFDRFSTQSFERFIQAIAASIGGQRTQIFGAGRDGAREATIEGGGSFLDKELYGYVVFQAKYLTRSDGFAKDLSWVKRQITVELSKYRNSTRGLRRPETYIFATNVRLSAGAANDEGKGAGGIDLAFKHLESEATKLGIETVYLWHADTLGSLVDAYPNLKLGFSSWIESSDVMAAIIQGFRTPNQQDTLLRYFRRAIQQSRDIKTRDAGQALSRTIGVSDVFVDLPVAISNEDGYETESFEVDWNDLDDEQRLAEEYQNPENAEPRRTRAVWSLLNTASDCFSANVVREDGKRGPLPTKNKVLILAGPGQGKSTVSQFLSQVYRANILALFRRTNTAEVNSIIDSVYRRMRSERIDTAQIMRIPLHVDLPRFADETQRAILRSESLSIFSYLASLISAAADETVDSALLQSWLKSSPSLFILDGLDEVPASGGRENVIDAVNQLNDFICDLNLDAMIVVTSRPQGYQDELARKHWLYWTLQELNTEESLSVASSLAPVLITDPLRQEEVLDLLTEAARDEATAALMTSPLQVTLLFTLVASHNNIPKDRWTLFLRHYETLRDREIAKGGSSGKLIGEFKNQIDRLHYDAGFILQVKAEQPGAANSYFTEAEFFDLVLDRLNLDGYEGVEAVNVAKAIAKISTDRLVFLRSGIEGQIAFDVRSLQEFMAAARLTLSPERLIITRLAAIVGKAHWLHVVKIAVSRIYGSSGIEALRDPFLAMLDSFNNGDFGDEPRLIRAGSQLAINLLSDGAALTVPLYRRRILQRAFTILSTYDQTAPALIGRTIDDLTRSVADVELPYNLNSNGNPGRANAIKTLIVLSNDFGSRNLWIDGLTVAADPLGDEELLKIIDDAYYVPRYGLLAERFIEAQKSAGPARCLSWYHSTIEEIVDLSDSLVELLQLRPTNSIRNARFLPATWDAANVDGGEYEGITITYRGIAPAFVLNISSSINDVMWRGAKLLNNFQCHPSTESLATLIGIRANDLPFDSIKGLPIPWIVSLIISRVDTGVSTEELCADIRSGAYGNETEWAAAEERWSTDGVSSDDIAMSRDGLAWLRECATIGAPFPVGRRIGRVSDNAIAAVHEMAVKGSDDSWSARTLLSISRRGRVAIYNDYLVKLRPQNPIGQRMLVDALLSAFEKVPDNGGILDALVNAVAVAPIMPVVNDGAISKIVSLIVRGDDRKELIELVARSALTRGNRKQFVDLAKRAISAWARRDGEDPLTPAAYYLKLRAFPEDIVPSDAAEVLRSEPRYYMSVLEMLGKGSSHDNQLATARIIATKLLIEDVDGSQKPAYVALTTDVGARISDFANVNVLRNMELPVKAVPQ
jgi:hypothetical protein